MTEYRIQVTALSLPNDVLVFKINKESPTKAEFSALHPFTNYNISITSYSDKYGEGGVGSVTANTLIGIPSPVPPSPKTIKRDGQTLEIEIPPLTNDNGPVSSVHIVVWIVDSELSQTFDSALLTNYTQAQEDGTNYYIAAEIEYRNQQMRFVVGDGKRYGDFINAPLPTNHPVAVTLGIISQFEGLTKKRYATLASEKGLLQTTEKVAYSLSTDSKFKNFQKNIA